MNVPAEGSTANKGQRSREICPKCGKDFANRHTLRRHLEEVCTDNKVVFWCTMPNCGRAFARKYSLKQHIKEYRCDEDTEEAFEER